MSNEVSTIAPTAKRTVYVLQIPKLLKFGFIDHAVSEHPDIISRIVKSLNEARFPRGWRVVRRVINNNCVVSEEVVE